MRHSRRVSSAIKKPIPTDVKSLAQLSWRHMYQKAVALWHALSAAEQMEWESASRPKHMTGFAWFMSQALKPNPGLYLPLQGGVMAGDIDMAKHRLLKLPLPVDSQEPLTLAYYTANIAPYLYDESARVTYNISVTIPNGAVTYLAFNIERWDTDTIHDNAVNNSRLTCKTAGRYLIVAQIALVFHAVGRRYMDIILNRTDPIIATQWEPCETGTTYMNAATIWDLAVNDYVEIRVYQDCGAGLASSKDTNRTPEFMMERIGP